MRLIIDSLDRVAVVAKVGWPLALWIFVAAFSIASNPAMGTYWYSPSTPIVPLLLSISFMLVCMVLGTRSTVDALPESLRGADIDETLARHVPTAVAITTLLAISIGADRYAAQGYPVIIFGLFYTATRIAFLLGFMSGISLANSVMFLLISGSLASAVSPWSASYLVVGALIALTAELAIAAFGTSGRGVERAGLGILAIAIAILAVRLSSSLHLHGTQSAMIFSVLAAGVVAVSLWICIKNRIRWLFLLGGVALIAVGLFMSHIIMATANPVRRNFVWFGLLIVPILAWVVFRLNSYWSERIHGTIAACATLLIVAFSLCISLFGSTLTQMIGSLGLVSIALGLWGLLFVFVFVYLPRRLQSLRWTIAILAIIILPISIGYEREPGLKSEAPIDSRTSFEDTLDMRLGTNPSGAYYVVASAGGGLRAAAHTAYVLELLDVKTCGDFGKRLLAVSGVSGGTVGLGAYLLSPSRRASANPTALCNPTRDPKIHGEASVQFIRRDYLADIVGTMLFAEPLGNLIPGLFVKADRGMRLRSDWERSWRLVSGDDSFSRRLLDSTLVTRGAPLFVSNTTSVATGNRVFISSHSIELTEASDVFEFSPLSRDMLVSEMLLNSARFPIVSPSEPVWTTAPNLLAMWESATIRDNTRLGVEFEERVQEDTIEWARHMSGAPRVIDYLVDGGYFENSGAETLSQIIPIIEAKLAGRAKLRVIIIHNAPMTPDGTACKHRRIPLDSIDIYPKLPGDEFATKMALDALEINRRFATEQDGSVINGPLNTFLRVREARGALAVRRLAESIGCENIREAYFREVPGWPSPALSWHLDHEMHSRLRNAAGRFAEDFARWD